MKETVLPCKVSILMYARCSDFVTWVKKFSASSSDNSHEISTKQPQKWLRSLRVKTTHCWPTKPDSNLYFSRPWHSASLLGQSSYYNILLRTSFVTDSWLPDWLIRKVINLDFCPLWLNTVECDSSCHRIQNTLTDPVGRELRLNIGEILRTF